MKRLAILFLFGLSAFAQSPVVRATTPADARKHTVNFVFNGGGTALATSNTVAVVVPFACTISGYNLAADAGTFTVKIWKKASGTAIPTISDVINTSGLALATGTALISTTTSDFTSTTNTANDIWIAAITAVATATWATVSIRCDIP